MPAKSKAQQQAAGAALSVKEHERRPESSLKGASKSMYGSMSQSELRKLASTSRKNMPEHVSRKK